MAVALATVALLVMLSACQAAPAPHSALPMVATTSTSAVASKCAVAAFLWPEGHPKVLLHPDRRASMTLRVGDRLLLGGPPRTCRLQLTFDGEGTSRVLVTRDSSDVAARWYTAARPGTVTVTAVQPMCSPPNVDHPCYGGLAPRGSVAVTVERREQPVAVTRHCRPDDFTVLTEAEAAGSFRPNWGTATLASPTACRLRGTAAIRVLGPDGGIVPMPHNPDRRDVDVALRRGHPVVVQWWWQYPFCGGGRRYTVVVSVLGVSGGEAESTAPSCPTDYGGQRRPPRGLRFDEVTVLR